MAQETITVVQIEEIARRIVAEEMEGLRREVLREMREQAAYGPGMEQVGAILRELAQSHTRAEGRLAGVEAALETLARAQVRTEEEFRRYREASEARFARIEAALDRLAEAQARTEEEFRQYREASEARFARIEAALDRLTEAQARTEERVTRLEEAIARLTEAQARTEERVTRLEEAIARLTEAQARTEERVTRLEEAIARLTEAQARTEERVTRLEEAIARLTEAQARTEERVTRLEEAIARLTEAQARTEERLAKLEMAVERLAAAQEQMARQLGALSNLLGADLEVDAEEVLAHVMRQKGYRPVGPPYPMEVDGEIDVAMLLEGPEGTRVWALIEVKARLRKGDVERWGKRLRDPEFLRRLAGVRIEPPYLPYAFGLRVYPDAEDLAREMGIGVLDSRGERAEARPL
jgi:DNA repair exonuclease SbcCD ATPase subunit